ncbi:MAG: hypothetical protein HOV94_07210 [Saccharothrix sp.]|nr:hypothetical protein [Saccharothrix sp.]
MAKNWWDEHDTGRVPPGKDAVPRPKPGSRVQDNAGRTGTVCLYEGQWPSSTYPVKVDHGVTEMWSASTPTDVPPPAVPAPRKSEARGAARSRRAAR